MRILTILTTLAMAGGAVAGASIANASSHTAAHAEARTTVHHAELTLTAHPRGGGQVDVAPAGVSLGDEFFEHGTLGGDAGGSYSLSGELVQMPGSSTPPWESQHFTLRLRHGTIEAIGQHRAVNKFTIAIVGGTGHWRHASGTLHVSHGHMYLDARR